ncbi:MAG: chitobiase/beta-hexosaminidase C-terminal domain-containing protein [Verrucomicrobia bacterium]|nr:chitobiase/beta-hexosaminidase C-terminal domain-containing protein [Verrucomicrobiota bacterium]
MTLLLFALGWASRAQAADPSGGFSYHWAQTVSGPGDQQANSVAVDPSGQIHVTGYFVGPTDFHGASITNVGLFDLFVARYRRSGELIWAKSLGGPNQDVGLGVAGDAEGNTLVAGYFQVGALLGGTKVTNAGSSDGIVMKLNPAGAVTWTRAIGGTGDDRAYGVATDALGNVYAAGHFQDGAKFGDQSLTNRGAVDLFVVKYDPDGNLLWVRGAGGGNVDVAYAIAVDPQGNAYVAGYFGDQAVFQDTTLTATGNADLFVAKYSPLGELLWVRSGGGTDPDYANAVTATPDGGAVIAGTIRGQATFGSKVVTGAGLRTFVARYDSAGELLWIQTSAGSDARGVAWADNGVFLIGHFIGTMSIGADALVSRGNFDAFVVRYGANGAPEWSRSLGGPSLDYGYAIASDGQQGCLLAGRFTDAVSLDRLNLSSAGSGDAFLAKLSPAPFISAHPVGQTVLPGADTTLTAAAVGASPLSYQWFYNQTNDIPGATSSSLSLTNLDPIQTGLYSLTASNAYGSVTSAPAFLNVFGLPRPIALVQGVAGTLFGLTNQTSARVALTNPVPDTLIYYSLDGTRPTFESLAYTVPLVVSQSVTLRATAYNAAFAASETPPIPITFYLSAPRIVVQGREGASLSFTNTPSLSVQMTPPLEKVRLYYTLNGSDPATNSMVASSALVYTSPFVITQTTTIKAVALRPGMTSAVSDPTVARFFQEYALDLEPTLDGAITRRPPGPTYLAGTTVQLTADAELGWSFMNWTLDAQGGQPQVSVVMDGPRRVGAVFGTTLTTTNLGGGGIIIDPPAAMYPRGAVVQATATPEAGQYFALWGGIGSGSSNPITLKIAGPVPTLSALFSPLGTNRYALTILRTGSGRVEVNPYQVFYEPGAEVTAKAVENDGWRFTGWQGDLTVSTNPLRLLMNKSYSITALFTAQEQLELQSPFYSNGVVSFQLSAPVGRIYEVQRSLDYSNWTTIQTLTNQASPLLITNGVPDPSPPLLLYRAFLPLP